MENIEHRTSNVEPRIQTGGGVFGVLRSVLRSIFSLRSWLILLVRIYRCTLSPAKNVVFGPAAGCRFTPSCSQYAIEALKAHGAISGSWLAVKRICRCHPWGACGCDPVPPVKLSSSHFRV